MLRIQLTDPISVSAQDGVYDERALGGRRPRLVLTMLVCERHRAVSTDELAEALWPHGLPPSAASAVRTAVSRIRSLLPDAEVTGSAGAYRLVLPDDTEVDLEVAASLLDAAERATDTSAAADAASTASEILRRPFLPAEEGGWVEVKRVQIHAMRARALDLLASARSTLGRHALAAEAAEEAVALEPFRDAGYALLMRVHAAAGNRAEALRAYERCRTLLSEELGVDPAAEVQTLHFELLRDERPDAGHAPLPAPFTSFVGRTPEIAEVDRLVGSSRLVTLTGAGGCGKTRLAIEVARRTQERRPVRFVDLAPLHDPSLLTHTVAAALGIRDQAGRDPLEATIAHLRDLDLILVLDNCEHLIGQATAFVERVLAGCPGVRVLATSREALGIVGEVAWRVPSLGPDDAALLFRERALAAKPDLAFRPDDDRPIALLCERLDGIPLALELAASRTAVLGVRQIVERLDDRLALLAAERGADPRHRTLRATVDWSYDLLDAQERTLFRRLGVFSGGFSLDAAETVAAQPVIEQLGRLVAKSLVDCDTTSGEARYRLLETMRQYARERLGEHGEEHEESAAHALWCTQLAETASSGLAGPEQLAWLARLDADLDNLRTALGWSIRHDPDGLGLRLASALSLYWHMRGRLAEGRLWLAAALEAAPEAPADRRANALWGFGFLSFYIGSFAEALRAAGDAAALARRSGDDVAIARSLNLLGERLTGDPVAARSALEESIVVARRCGDDWCLADSLGKLGWTRIYQGDPVGARPFFRQCEEIARRMGDSRNLRRAVAGLGWTSFLRGIYAEAQEGLSDSLVLARGLGDNLWIAQLLNVLGELGRARGDLVNARRTLDEALQIATEVGSPFVLNLTHGFLGRLARSESEPERARELFIEAHAHAGRAGLRVFFSWWLRGRGEAALDMGDLDAARTDLAGAHEAATAMGNAWDTSAALAATARLARSHGDDDRARLLQLDALTVRFRLDDRPGIADSIEMLAGLEARHGDAERAAHLFGAADAQRAANGFVRWDAERYEDDVANARRRLGADVFASAFAQGRAMPPPRAVAYAIAADGVTPAVTDRV